MRVISNVLFFFYKTNKMLVLSRIYAYIINFKIILHDIPVQVLFRRKELEKKREWYLLIQFIVSSFDVS